VSHSQHILAEVNTDRCADLRRELAVELDLASYDELRVIAVFVRRLAYGRNLYGYLDLHRDRRDFKRERAEEYVDLAVYDACIELDRTNKPSKRTAAQNRKNVGADRATLIAAKLCIRCRKTDARTNRRTCKSCGAADAKRSADRRSR
jgi:hypothetical protein